VCDGRQQRTTSFLSYSERMKTPSLLVVLLTTCLSLAADGKDVFFSAHALSGAQPVNSPNGNATVSLQHLGQNADDFPTEVKVREKEITLASRINFGLNAEVLWNVTSTAFTVTGSSEGASGQYHTDAFVLESNRLVHIPLTRLIESAFGHPVKCGWPEAPNVAAIKWLNDSTVLVAAEIIAHSNCDSFGTFKAFSVDVRSRRVIRTYDQLAVKRLYGPDLGVELRNANDECIRHPSACFVSTNHPERKQ
jgi:hypothetical protein